MRYTTRIIVPPRIRRSGAPGTPGGTFGPQALGVRKSFGFGDRLGLATPGHLAAVSAHPDFAPVFAQQSIREMTRTGRTPQQVMAAAVGAVSTARFRQPWGADADHLKTPQDVENTAAAGFTFFTIDPSEFVRADADQLAPDQLATAVAELIAAGDLPEHWSEPYLNRTVDLPGNQRLRLTLEPLQRAALKYGRAVNHCARMSETAARANRGRSYEIEVSFDETDAPTSPLEHLFIGLELEARGVRVTSLAVRLPGDWEKGIDFRGDLAEFEARLREHAAVAEFCGPYKLSIHSGSDKFSVYPIIGRCCGDALHVKTAGTSYLEALRVVARTDLALFDAIARYCHGRFEEDRRSYHLSTTQAEVDDLRNVVPGDEERRYLDERVGRQLLHVTFGSVLSQGQDERGRPFKEAILELLDRRADLYQETLVAHFEKHLSLLNAG